ncbi:MAG: ABC transporter permease [Armatimonadota bacterium]
MSPVAASSLSRPRSRTHTAALVASAVLCGAVLLALGAGVIAPYPPRAITGAPIEIPSPSHRLGTNDLGQDLLSVWLYGARVSLTIGFFAAALSTAAAGAVGLLSVTWRAGRLPLLSLTDALLAIPHLPMIVLIVALLGPGLSHLIAALVVLGWPAYARVVRAQALVTAQREYVEAARALGASEARILRTCFIPEILPLLSTKFLLTVRWAILLETALALLGLGDSTQISWGTMLNSAFVYPLLFVGDAWLWWAMPPAVTISAVTLALAAIGRDFENWPSPR